MTLSSDIIKFVELNGPSTVFDIAKALNLTPKRVSGVISKLVKEGKLKQTELVVEGKRRYRVYLPKKWDKSFVQWHGKILAVEGHKGRPLPLTQRIIELLQNSDKALFSTEIADLLDADRRSVSRALSELWKSGKVKKGGRRYAGKEERIGHSWLWFVREEQLENRLKELDVLPPYLRKLRNLLRPGIVLTISEIAKKLSVRPFTAFKFVERLRQFDPNVKIADIRGVKVVYLAGDELLLPIVEKRILQQKREAITKGKALEEYVLFIFKELGFKIKGFRKIIRDCEFDIILSVSTKLFEIPVVIEVKGTDVHDSDVIELISKINRCLDYPAFPIIVHTGRFRAKGVHNIPLNRLNKIYAKQTGNEISFSKLWEEYQSSGSRYVTFLQFLEERVPIGYASGYDRIRRR